MFCREGGRDCPGVASLQPRADSLFDEFIQSVGVLCFDTCAPAHHGKEDGAHNTKLAEHVEHLVAYVRKPEPPKEVESAQALLEHNHCVCGPLHYEGYEVFKASRRIKLCFNSPYNIGC